MHLRVLKDAGLVGDQAVGNRRIYHLEPEALRQLRDHLDWYWERSLAAYQRAAEKRARELKVTAEQEIVVAKTVRVNAPAAVAFEVFVEQKWWPVQTHHLADSRGSEVMLEPFQGGRWYEQDADGTQTDWGIVLAWQPPYRLLLTFQVSPRWTYEQDPALGSEIEVTFTPEGQDVTRVDFTHRHLERHGTEAERMRRILDGKGGEPLPSPATWPQGPRNHGARHDEGENDAGHVCDAEHLRGRRGPHSGVLPRGDITIAISSNDAVVREGMPAPTPGHPLELVVGCESADDAVAALRSAGTPILMEPHSHFSGHRRAYVADPDGNWIALISKESA